jgi:Flp pilus assembly protein TadG
MNRGHKYMFIKDERGGVLIFVGLALTLMMIAVGVAVDMGRVLVIRSKAMSALDAAVIATASRVSSTVSQEALKQTLQSFYNVNFSDVTMGVKTTITSATYNENTGTVDATINVVTPTLFGGFLTMDTVNIGLKSEVSRQLSGNDFEIAFVLDITPSMCFDHDGKFSLAACKANPGKLKSLRDNVAKLINTVNDAVTKSAGANSQVYYSFVPFIHTVRVDDGNLATDDLKHVSWPYMPLPIDYLPRIRGLSTNGQAIIDSLDSVMANIKNVGGTNTSIGTYWGWLSLRSASRGRFVGLSSHADPANHPAPMNDGRTFKMMLILTDGANTYYNWKVTDWSTNPVKQEWVGVHDTGADHDQSKYCQMIDKEGIDIFTIAFDVPKGSDADAIKDILRNDCAQEDKYHGRYFDASNADELTEAFEKIARYIVNLRITQ